jgi:peptidoglycan/LPS O-acetylase OafA/YrhL
MPARATIVSPRNRAQLSLGKTGATVAFAGFVRVVLPSAAPVASATFGSRMSGRENNFDFLRVLLATLVVFEHSYHALNPDWDPLIAATSHQKYLGQLAVMGFFAISGLLVTASWERSAGAVDYFRKRALRIYPGFIVCWLVCILVVAPISGMTWSAYRQCVRPAWWLVKIVLLRGFGDVPAFPGNPLHVLNAVLWTIPQEFGCYILVAVVGVAGLLRRPRALAAFAVVAYVVGVFPGSALGVSDAFLEQINVRGQAAAFVVGAAFYVWRDHIPFRRSWALACAAALVIAARVPPLLELIVPACGSYLLFWAAYDPAIRLHHFGRRADLSYGIYLYGWPIQQLLVQHFAASLTPWRMFAVALPLTCVAALVSWTFVERPCLRWKASRIASAPAAPEAG